MRDFPPVVRRSFGLALYVAQLGEMPPDAKPLKGFGGAGVIELLEDHKGDAYRAVYTVRFSSGVLRAPRISEEGKAGHCDSQARTRPDPAAIEDGTSNPHGFGRGTVEMKRGHETSSGNVFADLGLKNAEQELVKARLTLQIYQLLKARGLTQAKAAALLGTTQAQVSTLMRCRPTSVSVGRLMEFLTILGQDIEVTVKPALKQGTGHMSVTVQPG